jgi:uncharacterized protein (DUF736 family)
MHLGRIETAWCGFTKKAGKAYISVKLDDPSFAQPIYCVLLKVENDYMLEWNRQAPRRLNKMAGSGEL